MKKKASRKLMVFQSGKEIFEEKISTEDKLQEAVKAAKVRLSLLQQAFPTAKWAMQISDWRREKVCTRIETVDVKTGKSKRPIIMKGVYC